MGSELVREVRAAYNLLRHPPSRQEMEGAYGFSSSYLSRLFSDNEQKKPAGANKKRLEELLNHLHVLQAVETGTNKLVPVYDGPVPLGAAAKMNMSSMEPMGDGSEGRERLGRRIKDDTLAPLFVRGDIAVFDDSEWQEGELVYAVAKNSEDDVIGFATESEGGFTIEPLAPDRESVSSFDGWTIWGVAKGKIRIGEFHRDEKHFSVRVTREVVDHIG